MKRLQLSLLLAAAIFLSGCLQTSVPSQCTTLSPSKLANCIYINAVVDQNPFYCYSLEDVSKRATCLQDASEPSMRKVVQRSLPSEKDRVFSDEPAVAPPTGPAQPEPEQTEGCPSVAGDERDRCLLETAIGGSDVESCEDIASPAVVESCIAQIGSSTKNIALCEKLSEKRNQDLCKLYARG